MIGSSLRNFRGLSKTSKRSNKMYDVYLTKINMIYESNQLSYFRNKPDIIKKHILKSEI